MPSHSSLWGIEEVPGTAEKLTLNSFRNLWVFGTVLLSCLCDQEGLRKALSLRGTLSQTTCVPGVSLQFLSLQVKSLLKKTTLLLCEEEKKRNHGHSCLGPRSTGKMLNVISHRKMQIKTTVRGHFTSTRMAEIKTDRNKR